MAISDRSKHMALLVVLVVLVTASLLELGRTPGAGGYGADILIALLVALVLFSLMAPM
jgi:hypothetical protein